MIQEKQTNSERIKRVTIIPNEKLHNLSPFTKKCEIGHREILMEYVCVTDLNVPISNITRTSSQELAYHLTTLGFCVMLYNSIAQPANLEIYLPQKFGTDQKKYFELATAMLGECNLSVLSLNEKGESFIPQFEASQNVESLLTFVDELNINNPKAKVKKPEKNQ